MLFLGTQTADLKQIRFKARVIFTDERAWLNLHGIVC